MRIESTDSNKDAGASPIGRGDISPAGELRPDGAFGLSPGKTSLKIAVGIATAGRREILSKVLRHHCRQTRLPDLVLVCATDEKDVDRRASKSPHPPLQIIFGPKGLCHQRNVILDNLEGFDVVVFLDDDFVMHCSYLSEVERLFLNKPDVAMSTGKVIADGITGPGIEFEDGIVIAVSAEVPADAELRDIHNGYGCNMAVRVSAIQAGNIRFDENLPLYGWLEDVDFSRRLVGRGRIVRSERLLGVHLGSKSGRTNGVRLGYSQIANPYYLFRKNTLSGPRAARRIARNILANAGKYLWAEPWVDRKGRMKGNLLALGDLLRGRISPENILTLE